MARRTLRFAGRLRAQDAPDAALERVDALRRELAAIEQDTIDTTQLDPHCDALKRREWLQHPSAAVRAAVACCLADMLRLYAPNAPFSESEITQIFAQFLTELTADGGGVADRDAPQYAERVYVLQSLSTVKSVALVCDVPSASKLVASYVTELLAVAAHDLATPVELALTDVLVQLVEEAAAVPRAALDALLHAFDDAAPAAQHRVAAAVCRATQDRLQKHVAHHFSDALRAGRGAAALRAAHARTVRLGASAPSLLTSVVPQLAAQLTTDDADAREHATRTLAALFALDSAPLATQHAAAWRAWKARAADRAVPVRLAWVAGAFDVLAHHAPLGAELADALAARAADPEERVRAALARAVGTLDLDTLRHAVPTAALEALAHRGRDRRAPVRDAALDALGRAYALAYPTLARDADAAARLAWIPRAVLPCALAGTAEVVRSVARVLDTALLPRAPPPTYAARLLALYRGLDEESRAALYFYTNLRLARPSALDAFVDAWAAGTDVGALVRPVCAVLRDSECAADLAALGAWRTDAAAHARTAFDPTTPADAADDACAAALALAESAHPALVPTLAALLRAGRYAILHTDLVLPLVDLGAEAAPLRAWIARDAPQLLAPHRAALAERAATSAAALELLAALATHERLDIDAPLCAALVRMCEADDADVPDDAHERAADAPPEALEAAATVLACTDAPQLAAAVRALEPRAALGTAAEQARALRALGAVAAHAPHAVSADTLGEHATAVLLRAWDGAELAAWDAAAPPALAARLAALAALVRVCAGAPDVDRARPVLRLLLVLAGAGEARADLHTPPRAAARMRLAAAEGVLGLAEVPAYAPLLRTRLARVAPVLQDEAFEVRSAFLDALLRALARGALPPEWHALLGLVALDPEDEVRARVAAYARRAAAHGAPLAAAFARFLHLLAHHPDLDVEDEEALVPFGAYVDFFVACAGSPENVGALAHTAAELARAADAVAGAHPDALAVVGELAQLVVQRAADARGWAVSRPDAPPALPQDLVTARTQPPRTRLPRRVAERLQDAEVRRPLTQPLKRAKRAKHL